MPHNGPFPGSESPGCLNGLAVVGKHGCGGDPGPVEGSSDVFVWVNAVSNAAASGRTLVASPF